MHCQKCQSPKQFYNYMKQLHYYLGNLHLLQNQEIITLLNFSKNFEGSHQTEVSLKMRTPLFMTSLKMSQERRTNQWSWPQMDFKDTQLFQRALQHITRNNKVIRDSRLFDRFGSTAIQASINVQNQRLSMYQKLKLNDCLSLNLYGCLQSQKPMNAKENAYSIYPNYGMDITINL